MLRVQNPLPCNSEIFCKGFDKGSASGRAGLIQLYAVNRLIFDLDTLHILAADIKDTVYIWLEEGSRIVVCDSFYFAFVQKREEQP